MSNVHIRLDVRMRPNIRRVSDVRTRPDVRTMSDVRTMTDVHIVSDVRAIFDARAILDARRIPCALTLSDIYERYTYDAHGCPGVIVKFHYFQSYMFVSYVPNQLST